ILAPQGKWTGPGAARPEPVRIFAAVQSWSSPDLKRRPIDCIASTTGSAYDLRLETVRLTVR
ncbi:MAG: hypothetical protein KA064_01520, partial [Firmicutes bacterium]|nr:hypothetical protein [Bacillota bacterium]